MSFQKAIETIIELNEEVKSSCLRAIKKINKNRNDAIDALCQRESDA